MKGAFGCLHCLCPCLEATGDIPSTHHSTGLVGVQELGLNWGKQAKIFMLLRGLGRAGTGWVKFWEHQNLCAAGMGECSTSSHFCPHGQGDVEGAEGQDDSRGWGGKGTSRGILSCKEPEISPRTAPAAFSTTLLARAPAGLALGPAQLLPNREGAKG